jgi:hypothetical protein
MKLALIDIENRGFGEICNKKLNTKKLHVGT